MLSALALLLGIAFSAHWIYLWLRPLIPLLIAGVVLIGMYQIIRRWWWF